MTRRTPSSLERTLDSRFKQHNQLKKNHRIVLFVGVCHTYLSVVGRFTRRDFAFAGARHQTRSPSEIECPSVSLYSATSDKEIKYEVTILPVPRYLDIYSMLFICSYRRVVIVSNRDSSIREGPGRLRNHANNVFQVPSKTFPDRHQNVCTLHTQELTLQTNPLS